MNKVSRFSPEVRERAVRMVFEHEKDHASRSSTLTSIASKIGYTPETLRSWVKRTEINQGHRPGMTTDERDRLRAKP